VAVLLSAVVFSVLVVALSVGNSTQAISTAKIELLANAREAKEAVAKDVRQSIAWEIANNSPTQDYMKFRQVTGWNAATSTLTLSSNFVEYVYTAAAQTLVRNTLNPSGTVLSSRTFNNITASPFYTVNTTNDIVLLNQADLLNSRRLVITITSQRLARAGQNLTLNLDEEVKIRNE